MSAVHTVSVPLEFVSALLVGVQSLMQKKMTVQLNSVRSIVVLMESATRQVHASALLASWALTAGTLIVVQALMGRSAMAMVTAPLSPFMRLVNAIAILVSQVHYAKSTLSMILCKSVRMIAQAMDCALMGNVHATLAFAVPTVVRSSVPMRQRLDHNARCHVAPMIAMPRAYA